jgi:hypothetical protein
VRRHDGLHHGPQRLRVLGRDLGEQAIQGIRRDHVAILIVG